MSNWKSLKDAAEEAGAHRLTLGKWVKRGLLKTRTAKVRNLQATLVDVDQVKKLIGDGLRAGRPRKS